MPFWKKRPEAELDNIFHCCIQRSGSQWIMKILGSPDVQGACRLPLHVPKKDYIISSKNRAELERGFPEKTIVSPLYVNYEDFLGMSKPEKFRAFWVMRDPRDLIVSRYFSAKYSHNILNESQKEERRILNAMSDEEGINYFIAAMPKLHKRLYGSMTSWMKSGDNPKVLVCRFEDLIGARQAETFRKVFDHCRLGISMKQLARLLEKYNFKVMARGRQPGHEDRMSHFRKGIGGDWKNYFSEASKRLFKQAAGGMLVELGYEKDDDW